MKLIKFVQSLTLAASALLLAPTTWADSARHHRDPEAVYTMSNAPDGNRVLAFRTKHDGTLEPQASFGPAGWAPAGASAIKARWRPTVTSCWSSTRAVMTSPCSGSFEAD